MLKVFLASVTFYVLWGVSHPCQAKEPSLHNLETVVTSREAPTPFWLPPRDLSCSLVNTYGIPPRVTGLSPVWDYELPGFDLAIEHLSEIYQHSPEKVRAVPVGIWDGGINLAHVPPRRVTFKSDFDYESQLNDQNKDSVEHGTAMANLVVGDAPIGGSYAGYLAAVDFNKLNFFGNVDRRLELISQSPSRLWNYSQGQSAPYIAVYGTALDQLTRKERKIFVVSAGNKYPNPFDPLKKNWSEAIYVANLGPLGIVDESSSEDPNVTIQNLSGGPHHSIGKTDENAYSLEGMGGTSRAAARVTAGISNALSVAFELEYPEVKALLEMTSIPTIYSRQKPRKNGIGMFNAVKFVYAAEKLQNECSDSDLTKARVCREEFLRKPHENKFSFEEKSKTLFAEAKQLLVGNCDQQQKGFKKLREAFLLDPSRQSEAKRIMTEIYRREGYYYNAAFLNSLDSSAEEYFESLFALPKLEKSDVEDAGRLGKSFGLDMIREIDRHLAAPQKLSRANATAMLGALDNESALSRLRKISLKDPEPDVVINAVTAARLMPSENEMEILKALSQHSSLTVAKVTFDRLAEIINAIASPKYSKKPVSAERALRYETGFAALMEVASHEPDPARALPALIALLRLDKGQGTREDIAARVLPIAKAKFSDPKWSLDNKVMVMWGLSLVEPEGNELIEWLYHEGDRVFPPATVAQGPNWYRDKALEWISGKPSVQIFRQSFESEDANLRAEAAGYLSKKWLTAAERENLTQKVVTDPNPTVRLAFYNQIGMYRNQNRLNLDTVWTVIGGHLSDNDEKVRRRAVDEAAALGTQGIEFLRPRKDQVSPAVRSLIEEKLK